MGERLRLALIFLGFRSMFQVGRRAGMGLAPATPAMVARDARGVRDDRFVVPPLASPFKRGEWSQGNG